MQRCIALNAVNNTKKIDDFLCQNLLTESIAYRNLLLPFETNKNSNK